MAVKFGHLTEDSMKMAVFWVVSPCSGVEVIDVSEALAVSIVGRCINV